MKAPKLKHFAELSVHYNILFAKPGIYLQPSISLSLFLITPFMFIGVTQGMLPVILTELKGNRSYYSPYPFGISIPHIAEIKIIR
jgi:hypothetical protein